MTLHAPYPHGRPRRLRRDDFEEPAVLAMFGNVCNPKRSADDFRREFGYVVENEAPPLDLLHSRDREGNGR